MYYIITDLQTQTPYILKDKQPFDTIEEAEEHIRDYALPEMKEECNDPEFEYNRPDDIPIRYIMNYMNIIVLKPVDMEAEESSNLKNLIP